jgi:hypothetical protein
MMLRVSLILPCLLLACFATGCKTIKKAVSWVPVPNLSSIPIPSIPLPSFSSIKRVIPGMDRHDKIDSRDPDVPFSPEAILAPGHTLRMKVYSGGRSAREEFEGLVKIDDSGIADFDDYGKARLAGLTAAQARQAVETQFLSCGFSASAMTAQIISIENIKLVFVDGDVRQRRVLEHHKRLRVRDAVMASGGRRPGSMARAVYVTQDGLRRFYRSEAVADEEVDLEAGDVILLSPVF